MALTSSPKQAPRRTTVRPIDAAVFRNRPITDDGSLHHRARSNRQIRLSKVVIGAGDLIAMALALVVATAIKERMIAVDPTPLSEYVVASALTIPVWLVAMRGRRLYESRFIGRRSDEWRRIVDACAISVVAVILIDFFFQFGLARTWVVLVGLSSVVSVALYREGVRQVFKSRRRRGVGLRRVVVVGHNGEADGIEDMLRRDRSIGYEVVARVEQRAGSNHPDAGEILIDDTLRAVRETDAQGVIIAATSVNPESSNQLVRCLAYSGLHLELSSTLSDISADRITMRPMGRIPVIYVEPVRRFGWRIVAKRAFDMVGSATLLVLTAPIMAAVALAVKITSPGGPVLFSQERVGRHGTSFDILKFRTMVPDAEARLAELMEENEADGPLFKMTHDPRITPIGRFLRKTSLDELPQLWNVLKGEMSLVGPRPALASEAEQWHADLFDRLRVRPGITGMWQVSGRSEASFDEYTRLDLYYVDNWSLIIDITIMLKTLPAVLAKRGAK